METKIFQDLFEQHVSTHKWEIAKKTNHLLFPIVSVYSVKRYDHTMASVTLTLESQYLPEQLATVYDFGQQITRMNALQNQEVGAVFLTKRVFYDTEKSKGNHVLQVFGLSNQAQQGQSLTECTQHNSQYTFSDSIGVFGYKQKADEFTILEQFLAGLGVITPHIVGYDELLTTEQFIEKVKTHSTKK